MTKNIIVKLGLILSSSLLFGCSQQTDIDPAEKISFNQHIRPILNKSCTGCHGGVGKQANVSFIYREEALARGHSGRLTIVPGDPDASELIARVEAKDPNIRMPYKGAPLPEHEIKLLRKWIEQGAEWEEHWAFNPPVKHPVPTVNNTAVINNEIDAFLQNKLESQNLSLTSLATKESLLRRVSFDLIGLPPTPTEIDAFLADSSADAFEKQVDRLLASPRYGERWAAMWMDLARYADSHGYTRDEERDTWPYKQWVIEAFNANKPYDQFVIEQLAGDLLANRTLDDVIATGFHRQTPTNSEGGTDDEEFRMVAVMDRNATTWSVLNAMTMNCVQCHAHPYDPIEHEAYYTSLSFFNTSKDADYRDYKPLYKLAKNEEQKQPAFLIQEEMTQIREYEAQQAFLLNQQTAQSNTPWQQLNIESAVGDEYRGLDEFVKFMQETNAKRKAEGKSILQYYENWIEVGLKQLKVLEQQGLRQFKVKDGEYFDAGKYETRVYYHLATQAFKQPQSINSLKLIALPQNPEQARHTPEKRFQIEDVKIYLLSANGERRQLAVKTYLANTTEVMHTQLSELSTLPTNDGFSTGKGVGWYAHHLYQPRWSVAVLQTPLELQAGDKLEFELAQTQQGIRADSLQARLHRVRIEATNYKGWSDYAMSDERQQNVRRYGELSQKIEGIDGYEMPVMLEQDVWDARGIAKFNRGNMIAKVGPLLAPNTPKIFPEFAGEKNRLGFAKWFFQPEQPLTARVAVNRLWHRLFGIGIVETLEDFGSAGALPKHPELLDWLAIKFQQELKWDMKAMLKFMVMSHAYQQDATVKPELFELDPHNQLYARGPRQRLSAEMIRDQALTASGLIYHQIGGEPVMPPQPEGIWGHPGKVIKEWTDATDEQRYRRAIYTFIKRAFMYPSFLTFDMETREFSHERRIPTNTPLQALVTLNDPVYHEAAQALGNQMQQAANEQAGIEFGFKQVLSRQPTQQELQSLTAALAEIDNELMASRNTELQRHADKWAAMGSILLNLDEALVR
ncbi:PSD1 and planctomycete cytochrome C domain-containing protein [Catenovulum agarivorans]|uniref:PSD1 and planctomycete cytochrome C domain-containing protein n=1 Tax=Catenovulum agarivorans TaxID=1172192 RepID=UPI00030E5206|nr:PSD1 and planctomycete cytochrome C domain-containing protein [Catenovulum agarivorans]